MSPKITKKEEFNLNNHLYEACNILRGPINQDDYKSYVTPLLFFKRISDVYDEETAIALEESGGDYEYAQFPENHSFIIPDGYHWNDIREKTENIGSAISTAMVTIERKNPKTLHGLFTSFDDANWADKSKLSDERLKDLVEHMSSVNVGNQNYDADLMGDAYEFLIKKFADLSKKNAGEFYTPRAVVKLLIKILDPKLGETVYDPACGTGGMLIEAIRHMHGDKLSYGKIYGQEKNLSTSAIARMNLFLHGAKDFKIAQGDTLRDPKFISAGQLANFDCVIANPPFSLDNWGAEIFESDIYGRNLWGTPPATNGDFAWIQHMIKSMARKTGRLGVVLPQGVLFRGNKEYELRKQLIESDKLEAVITLVNNLFYGATIPACLLIIRNDKPDDHKGKVALIDASTTYTPKRAQNILEEKDVNSIFDLYTNFDDVEEKVKIVTLDNIKEKDYTLSVNRYVEKKQAEIISLDEAKKIFFAAMEEVFKAEENLKQLLTEGGYLSE